MVIWRISEHADLSGEGGIYASGRWHQKGHPIVYCSDHPSTALLEILVHVDLKTIPETYQLLKIDCPDNISFEDKLTPLSAVDFLTTQAYGTDFLRENRACLLKVRSAIMPEAFNFLINPKHPDALKIKIDQQWRFPFDSRLFR
jgi:RES domain-containing protein